MYYRFPDKLPAQFVELFKSCNVKGKDAKKVLELQNALNVQTHAPYYLLDDKLAKFAIEGIDQLTVPARLAVLIVDIQIALTNPHKTIPTATEAPKTPVSARPVLPKPK
jgi:hypothetical protein